MNAILRTYRGESIPVVAKCKLEVQNSGFKVIPLVSHCASPTAHNIAIQKVAVIKAPFVVQMVLMAILITFRG